MLRTDFPLRKHICRHDPPRSIQTQIRDASDNAGSLFPIRLDNLAYNRVMHLDSVFLAVTDQSLRHLAISPRKPRLRMSALERKTDIFDAYSLSAFDPKRTSEHSRRDAALRLTATTTV